MTALPPAYRNVRSRRMEEVPAHYAADVLIAQAADLPPASVLAPVGIPGQVLVFDPVTWTECVLMGPTNSITANRCH